MEKYLQLIQDWFRKLTDEQKRRLALVCTVVFALFLTLSVLISLAGRGRGLPDEHERVYIISPIPAGELFIPDEPDFIPGVLLGRDRRESWTYEDAAEFWQDPLRSGEEPWRERIESVINRFWESVP